MGVHSLWEILAPSARPVRLEALSRRKLAVDASIWIYQFLKAVRDKEGHSLKNSHIVGFFRRICKLIYLGIQPVFVFDGGAPALKRNTIRKRKERRKDKLETLQQTAQKLLAIQLQKRANEEYQKEISPRKAQTLKKDLGDKELEFANYYEDFDYFNAASNDDQTLESKKIITPKKEKKVFRKDDEYHLPETELQIDKDDNRMITDWEFQRLTDGLETELEGIDLDNVDPTSESFKELPLAAQYMVLSHLRLRSRLRMGYTKEQLVTLFPNSMDFSKFQISMVQKRNFLTQKLMHVAGMDNTDIVATRRVAGERGREYQLMKNEDGYTLSLGAEGNSSVKPILLDEVGNVIEEKPLTTVKSNSDDDESDLDGLEFEDVPMNQVENEENTDFDIDLLFKETEDRMVNAYKSSEDYDPSLSAQNEIEMLILFHSNNESSNVREVPDTRESPKPEYQAPLNTINSGSQSSEKAQTLNGFSFKKSMLFGNNEARPQEISKITHVNESNPPQNNEVEPEVEPIVLESNSDEDVQDNSGSQAEIAKKPQKALPAPEWFGKSQVGFGVNNPYNTDYSIYNKELQRTADEEVGLFSLEDARELLEEQEEEEEEEAEENIEEIADDSDLEIIEDPTQELEKQINESNVENVEADLLVEENPDIPVLDYDFSESEEEELIEKLQQEELEHERFTSTLNNGNATSWSLENEKELQDQRRKDRRDADEVTQTMIQDVQELLSRFGIPFITAPMEAEAQCATLLELGLVDGIITDDSDCFLFGGDTVYKNMFNEKNYVECYIMEDIERDFGLTRDKMIELALLLGSDYTEGLKGVGKVTAMEILAEFQDEEKDKSLLVNFRNWWVEYQKGAKIDPKESSIKKKLRKTFQQKLFLDMGFPDPLVTDAYVRPEVDTDRTEFKWGTPDLDRLRTFLMYNIGWTQEKVDEVLVPVIKDINKKQQTTLGEFFPRDVLQTRRQLMVGKRLKEATNKLTTNKRQKK